MQIFNQWGGVALLLASSVAASAAAPSSVTINLYAGNPKNDAANKVVGTVTITSGSPGSIVFNITKPGYCLTGYHIYVGSQPPSTSAPGQYPYKKSLGCVTNHTVTPPINIPVGYYVAVHGEVNYGCEASPLPSPNPVPVCTTGLNSALAYVDKLRLNPLTSPTDYLAWCAARGIQLYDLTCAVPLPANVYSSLVTPPGGWWSILGSSTYPNPNPPTYPNWPAINYLLTKISGGIPAPHSMCDVQNAFWTLLGFPTPGICTGTYTPANTTALVNEALANAWPIGCKPKGKAAVVLVPYDGANKVQPLMIPADCKCKDDTIWAIPGLLNTPAYSFVGFKTGWGGYFLMP